MAAMMILMVIVLIVAPGHMGMHSAPESSAHVPPTQQQPPAVDAAKGK